MAANQDVENMDDAAMKGVKIIMIIAIWFCWPSIVFPKLLPSIKPNQFGLSLLNCLAAGIFLGLALINVIPKGTDIYKKWADDKGIERPYPLPYVLIFAGYFLVLTLDKAIAYVVNRRNEVPQSQSQNEAQICE